MWLHQQIAQTEEGQQTWEVLVGWLNSPPGTPTPQAASALVPQQQGDAWDRFLAGG